MIKIIKVKDSEIIVEGYYEKEEISTDRGLFVRDIFVCDGVYYKDRNITKLLKIKHWEEIDKYL